MPKPTAATKIPAIPLNNYRLDLLFSEQISDAGVAYIWAGTPVGRARPEEAVVDKGAAVAANVCSPAVCTIVVVTPFMTMTVV